eukprot:CAMPEP_0206012140 /NCGR_PEP_ID=MMETSP1464-20131121/14322_1 /ASSEMBLY_ACC=CAM_ASM_001124 /TAXON_ID=119497 /ORGANISM="Exanthemachrysis gayraliae, Strain RCC1523" /LENGTH=152 /DNA_ID=CAMNT_0053385817 /DNA_START=242 /DNA_END=697 /DNA_ORIENTATION=-
MKIESEIPPPRPAWTPRCRGLLSLRGRAAHRALGGGARRCSRRAVLRHLLGGPFGDHILAKFVGEVLVAAPHLVGLSGVAPAGGKCAPRERLCTLAAAVVRAVHDEGCDGLLERDGGLVAALRCGVALHRGVRLLGTVRPLVRALRWRVVKG